MPIIESLLDIDFYKFTMGQVVFHRYKDVPVRYDFINRTRKVHIPNFVDEAELREELDYARTLRFTKSELHYLRGTNEYKERMFAEDYLEFLSKLQLPEYHLEKLEDRYELEFPGRWSEAIYWETIGLAIINEFYYRYFMKQLSRFERDMVYAEGVKRLAEKVKILKKRPDITFCDFGTRRRFSRAWQDYVVRTLADELPQAQFLGTSNTYLAMKYSLLPMGTDAHERAMALSGIFHNSDEEIRASHRINLQDWWEEYGWGLSIALTDTFGSDFFFSDFTAEQARLWKGLRQDSGDPFQWTDKALAFYALCSVNAREKLAVYSDGLDVYLMTRIADYRPGEIRKTFGWGTNLTNDLGFPALSLVVKLMAANGFGTVKLSDNLAKALGEPENVERFKKIFSYTGTKYEECRY